MRIEINEATPAAPRTLSCGDELQIRLAENPTTGYRWHFEQSGTAVLALVEVLRGPYRPQGSFQPSSEVSYRGLTFYCAAAKLAPICDPDLSTGP